MWQCQSSLSRVNRASDPHHSSDKNSENSYYFLDCYLFHCLHCSHSYNCSCRWSTAETCCTSLRFHFYFLLFLLFNAHYAHLDKDVRAWWRRHRLLWCRFNIPGICRWYCANVWQPGLTRRPSVPSRSIVSYIWQSIHLSQRNDELPCLGRSWVVAGDQLISINALLFCTEMRQGRSLKHSLSAST